MFAQVLIVTFVLCLGLTVASALISRQLLATYASELLRHHFYYLAAFHAFAFYGLWGQILTRALLASIDIEAAAIEAVAGFLPVLGVPFLFVSWAMLINMAGSMFGKTIKPAWHSVHRWCSYCYCSARGSPSAGYKRSPGRGSPISASSKRRR